MKELGLYIHIPFCDKKCYYCDFTSFPDKKENIATYIDNLIKELTLYKDKINDYAISSIFIGGGTPSFIDAEYIKSILDYIYENYNISILKEVTIEANPGSITIEKAKLYKKIGINRISLGLQSLNNNLLKSIGRVHRADDFYESYKILRTIGFNNINIDLMFALPNQTLEDMIETLEGIIELQPEHISLYSLILEPGTLLYKWHEEGKINLISEEDDREMYHEGRRLLKEKGYKHYEISNFSKPNYECIQNLTYWKVNPYLGVGLSSHSNLENKRFWNIDNFPDYFFRLNENYLPIKGEELIDSEMEMTEYIILGLRLIEGINKEEFKKRFNIDIMDKYKNVIMKHKVGGLLIENQENIRLTNKGFDLANIVEIDFFS